MQHTTKLLQTLSRRTGSLRNKSSSAAPVLDQSWTSNAHNTFPSFNPVDNTDKSKSIDMARHHKEKWSDNEIQEAIKDNSVFSWGASDPLRDLAVHIDHAEGVYMYGSDGTKYMDWSAGAVCTNLGHTVPQKITDAVTKQMEEAAFVYGDLATHNPRARLCSLLAEIAPGDLNGFFFASGGSEANEAAIRIARRMTGRTKIMSRYRSYHGGSTAALAMTGDPRTWAVDSSTSGFVKIQDPFPFNFEWDSDPEVASLKCLDALHDQILYEGPNSIAAIFLEAVTGANGWLRTPTSFMQGVRALCDQYGILLVSDEVMNGFGRTGTMFGFQQFDGVMPDMFTFAKGVTSAYLPLSGIGMRDHVFDFFRQNPMGYGSTYFAHPVCCAAGYETVKHILEHDIVGQVQKMEPIMERELAHLVNEHPSVKQARVIGLGAGFDLAGKDGNFLMRMDEMHPGVPLLKNTLKENGLITLIRGHHVHCTPPLIITEDEIREGFEILHKSLDVLDDFIANE
jgi:taurine---2-oxoglutarate transaminase